MRLLPQLAAFIFVFVSVPALTGCPGRQPVPQNQDQTSRNNDVQAADSQDVDTALANAGMDLLAELGYDTATLEVISMELSPLEHSLLWNIKIGNGLDIVANFYVSEETLRFELMNSILIRDGVLAPSSIAPDDVPQERIAEALGLEEDGYRLAVENEAAWEFRKYAAWNEWEIAVSQVIIIVSTDIDVPILIDYRENELPGHLNISVDREAALLSAISFLGDSITGTEPSLVDLILFPSQEYGNTDLLLYWEFRFGDMVAHVNVDDGTILEAS